MDPFESPSFLEISAVCAFRKNATTTTKKESTRRPCLM